MFKDLRVFISKNFKWNNHINYLYQIAATTFFQDLDSFKSTDINILSFFLIQKSQKTFTVQKYDHAKVSPYAKVTRSQFKHSQSIILI